ASLPTAFTASSYAGSVAAFRAPRRYTSSDSPMHAIPHPSGWPVFGSGCGHPKSFGVLPVSERARNDARSEVGIGRSLTAPRILDMSPQLVADRPEELPPGLPVHVRLHALRTVPVDHADNPAAPRVLRDEDVDGVRGRAENRDDLGGVADRPQHVQRICVPEEDHERVARPDRHGVAGREVPEGRVVPLHPHEAGTARLAERDPEL